MLTGVAKMGASAWYWLALLGGGLALEGTALYYQYILHYGPCVLCIHIRIWVLALVLVSLAGLVLRRSRPGRLTVQALVVVCLAGLTERAWLLLAVEVGRVQGECSFASGLPAWLALDRWFPWLFQVQEACGVTPPLLFDVTMAEALLPLAAGLLALNLLVLLAGLFRGRWA